MCSWRRKFRWCKARASKKRHQRDCLFFECDYFRFAEASDFTELGRKRVAHLGLDLDSGEAGGIPAATKGFHEKNRGNEALALDDSGFLFTVQQILLGVDNVQIADQATGIAGSGNFELPPGRVHRIRLRLACRPQNLQARDVVLNLAKGVENGVTVRSNRGIVACLRKLYLRTACPTRKNLLRGVSADGPDAALGVEQGTDVRGIPATLTVKNE